MKTNKVWRLLSGAYDVVETALWSLGIALVVFLIVFVLPMLPTRQREYQAVRILEIANENALYCEKLNVKVGTQAYNECSLVLGEFRFKVEQRIERENGDF